MNDMTSVIAPRSDQLNADSLLAGPITIQITGVEIRPGQEQPVSIFFVGDDGKPYKPGISMSRVLVACWGLDAGAYVGRSMTIYTDSKVQWGGSAVGGIRISHLSHIKAPHVLALTMTKGNKKPFTVKPLVEPVAPEPKKPATIVEWVSGSLAGLLDGCATVAEIEALQARPVYLAAMERGTEADREAMQALVTAALARIPAAPATPDGGFPGDAP